MILMTGKLTRPIYLWINAVLAALFANAMLFGPNLGMGEAFTAGVASGIAVGWLIFALAGWRELRKPGRVFDERIAAIAGRSASFAFAVTLLALAVMVVLLRSPALGLELSAADTATLVMNLGLVAWASAWLVISKRS